MFIAYCVSVESPCLLLITVASYLEIIISYDCLRTQILFMKIHLPQSYKHFSGKYIIHYYYTIYYFFLYNMFVVYVLLLQLQQLLYTNYRY